MSMMETLGKHTYVDGRTKQAFKDSTDINKIIAKQARGDTISHLAKHGAIYGDFSDIDDLLTANIRLQKGIEIFEHLPAEVKREFDNSPGAFFNFVNDPANVDRLPEVLPGLAAPGDQMPAPRRTPGSAAADAAAIEKAAPTPEAAPEGGDGSA